jgi:hypothetical protein
LPRLAATAVIVGVGISQLVFTVSDWHLRDAAAYWEAALRLRDGQPLYPPLESTEASEIYRYAPWFAWLWVPLTYLPREAVMVAWSALLVVASLAAVSPLIRRRAWVGVAFFLPILIGISAIGNAHPLLVAMLMLGVERRSGPLWIATAASLKAVPILFVLVYVGRGQWRRALWTLAIAVVLVAPMLLYDLSQYSTEPGPAALLARWPLIFAGVVAAGGLAIVWLTRSRYGWLAAAATVTLATPRFFVYDVTYVMVGLADWLRGQESERREYTGQPATVSSSS